jgi:(p)ppGpp synthase/HD superfamily hydrolase
VERTPEFTRSSPLVQEAYRFAREAHTSDDLPHPVEVARLMAAAGYADEVIAAALLHDVVEDTQVKEREIRERFGGEVGELVAVLTEDAAVEPYTRRKAEHRDRIAQHSERAAAIYAADKLAKVRQAHTHPAALRKRKLAHYRRSYHLLRKTHPDLPFLEPLRAELKSLRDERTGLRAHA